MIGLVDHQKLLDAILMEKTLGLVLADAFAEKFGGDSLGEMRRNVEGYLAQLDARRGSWGADG